MYKNIRPGHKLVCRSGEGATPNWDLVPGSVYTVKAIGPYEVTFTDAPYAGGYDLTRFTPFALEPDD